MNDLRKTLLAFADPPLLPPDPLSELERRTARRRRRRALTRASIVVVSLIAVAGTVTIARGFGPRRVGVTADIGTTAVAPSTSALAAPTKASQPTCRNGTDPACGPFRWDPEPVGQPVTVRVSAEPSLPKVGEEVVFTVEVSSAAGPLAPALLESGDGGNPRLVNGAVSCTGPQLAPRYGPWDLPAPQPVQLTQRYAWTYRAPGSYVARYVYRGTACNPEYSPVYPSLGEGTITITVAPFGPTVVPDGWKACNGGRFAVAYPAAWEQGRCGDFDPDHPRHSEAPALSVATQNQTLAAAEAALQNPTWQVVTSRTEATVDGRRAVRIETECVPACGVAERDTTWLVDAGGWTVSFHMRWDPGLGNAVYVDRQAILEQVVGSLRV